MREPTLLEIRDLEPDEIDVSGRIRPVSKAGVASLIASIQELGLVKDEVIVRRVKHQGGKLKLIAGGHRVEACREIGRTVPAKIFDCTDDWARLMELDDNLAGGELTVLDTAIFLATRKEVYERLHPEAKRGYAGGKARHGQLAELSSVSSFASATAEKFGISERQVRKIVAAGQHIAPEEAQKLRAAPRPVGLADLQTLAKIGDAPERYHVLAALAGGKKASEGRHQWAVQQGLKGPKKSNVEQHLAALLNPWSRAPLEAKRRFVATHAEELRGLLDDHDTDEGDDA
ncbi:ParB/RepB/Spo0J family partition protein [Pseudoroseicyclus sp. H15]